ncbi:glycosyltransferase [Chitinimonas sp.]|uniref:glycosyltransferase family 2 protein n=1 Tax=Chitinimonas sp. TaxID=1934313 RepID=UPI0035AFC5BD
MNSSKPVENEAAAAQLALQRRLDNTEYLVVLLRKDKQRLNQQIADTEQHVRNLEAVITAQQRAYQTLLESHSWRITAPLRLISRCLAAWRQQGWAGVCAEFQRPAPSPQALARLPEQGEAGSEYQAWIERFERPDAAKLAAIATDIAAMASPPLISVLMPVYNAPVHWLRRAIESVREQYYPHWQLCIADDCSTDPQLRALLSDYAASDSRIRLGWREQNGHIAAATNSALALASGEFVCLLDHDDELAPHALYLLAQAIRQHPDAELFYSDEDKIDEAGVRSNPYFKPDWNPDLFLCYNLFNHLGAFKTSLIRELGGMRTGYEGSEDYDLVLRAVAKVGHAKVRHIPHVLYHWRTIAGSTAIDHSEKPYTVPSALAAVRDHLAAIGIAANVSESAPGAGSLRVRYALPAAPPKVSVIIPTRDGYALLRQCLDSVYSKTRYPNFDVTVVDNGSEDPQLLVYLQAMSLSHGLRVVRDDGPFNYSAINNRAARQVDGELLCLMNNDIEVISPDWLDEMVSQALRPEIGMVGCRLWYPDDTLQHAGVILGIGGVAGHAHHRLTREQGGYFNRARLVQNYSAITAACAVVRREVFWQVGGFNEVDLAVAFNDTDLCLRVGEAGYRNLWTPYAELYHHESATRGLEDSPAKLARFAGEMAHMQRRYGDFLLHDPAYNPNLALERQDYTLAYPPRCNWGPGSHDAGR